MIEIDELSLVKLIEEIKPKLVLVTCPSGIRLDCIKIISNFSKKYSFNAIFFGESCYGICDLAESEASFLQVDLILHIGHNSTLRRAGKMTYFIDAYDTISLTPVVEKALSLINAYKNIGLCTIGPHLKRLDEVQNYLQKLGFSVYIGDSIPPLRRGQIFGCNYSTCKVIEQFVDVFLFIGSSRFHAIGLYNLIGKPVILLDPYTEEVYPIEKDALKVQKHLLFNFYKAIDAKNIGVIIGLKEGQYNISAALELYKELNNLGKNAYLIAMKEISNEKLNEFQNIDAFIETACPRVSEDFFDKPILSLQYGYKLIEYLKGHKI
ncbi:MAG: diphthamide biosynthesis enzyme Dph2 [Nitrososphaeria archaeon]